MKTALCLSGQSRTFEKCFESQYNHIIQPLNADVFIHTWTFSGHSDIHSTHNNNYDIFKYKEYVESYSHITPVENIISCYKPKKILIEHPDYDFFIQKIKKSYRHNKKTNDFEYKLFGNENNYKWFNVLMMYYGIYMSNKLKCNYEKKKNMQYDLVIRSRMDLFFEKFNINNQDNHNITLPPNEDIDIVFDEHMKKQLLDVGPKFMPNDKFAYGGSKQMDYYSSAYLFFDKDVDYYPHHGEAVITEHLWDKNHSEYKEININNNIRMKIQR